eukprot:Hpha_TRINITY_DN808_c0_g2::TRINITY_DN808_c0_g2_i1::g.194890::m.194890
MGQDNAAPPPRVVVNKRGRAATRVMRSKTAGKGIQEEESDQTASLQIVFSIAAESGHGCRLFGATPKASRCVVLSSIDSGSSASETVLKRDDIRSHAVWPRSNEYFRFPQGAVPERLAIDVWEHRRVMFKKKSDVKVGSVEVELADFVGFSGESFTIDLNTSDEAVLEVRPVLKGRGWPQPPAAALRDERVREAMLAEALARSHELSCAEQSEWQKMTEDLVWGLDISSASASPRKRRQTERALVVLAGAVAAAVMLEWQREDTADDYDSADTVSDGLEETVGMQP